MSLHLRRSLIFAIVGLLIASLLLPLRGSAAQAPFVTSGPPRPPIDRVPPDQPPPAIQRTLSLPPLKAVLLVGPIDGNNGSWTRQEVANMELAAGVLESHGVTVLRFYPGQGTLAEIKQAAQGAHFLLYRGHGVYDGTMPHPNVGGFMLSGGYFSPDDIRELQLAPNAVIMLYGCFTAGSSSAEGDDHDIGIVEAQRRVAQYSEPFFVAGAAGYYADWFGDAFQRFLQNLFAGQTLGQAYENYFDFNPHTVTRAVHPAYPNLAMWVDKDNWTYWQYNNAFVGKPDQTLQDLFKPATLGGIPDQLAFTVTVANTITVQPISQTVTPGNISGPTVISWTLNSAGEWFNLSALSGHTPQSFTITPTTYDTTRPGHYTGVITVTATAPAGTDNSVQAIELSLDVLAPELGGLPPIVDLFYSIPDQSFMAERFTVWPKNTGSTEPLNWQATTTNSWLQVSPQQGQSFQSMTLTASGFATGTVATYSGSITLTATASAPVYGSPRVLPVTLHVIDRPLQRVYLPALRR